MTQGYIDRNGVRLWYEERGPSHGDPIVLVMGVGASLLWWPPDLVGALADAGHRVILFDNRDIGLSSHVDFDEAPYSLDDMVADTTGLLDSLHVERVHFVGMSLGGVISQVVALRDADRVRSLALISTTPGPDESLSPPTDTFMSYVSRPAEPEQDPVEMTVDFSRVLSGSRFPFDDSYYRQLATADIARGTNPDSSQGRIPVSSASRLADLRDVRVPTLVVHGTEDPVFPIDHAEALAGAIPGSTLIRWQGVGHEIPPPLVPELSRLLIAHMATAT